MSDSSNEPGHVLNAGDFRSNWMFALRVCYDVAAETTQTAQRTAQTLQVITDALDKHVSGKGGIVPTFRASAAEVMTGIDDRTKSMLVTLEERFFKVAESAVSKIRYSIERRDSDIIAINETITTTFKRIIEVNTVAKNDLAQLTAERDKIARELQEQLNQQVKDAERRVEAKLVALQEQLPDLVSAGVEAALEKVNQAQIRTLAKAMQAEFVAQARANMPWYKKIFGY